MSAVSFACLLIKIEIYKNLKSFGVYFFIRIIQDGAKCVHILPTTLSEIEWAMEFKSMTSSLVAS